MTAGLYDFTIEQGTALNLPLAWTDSSGNPINLAGYTAKMQLRDTRGNLILDVGALTGGLTINGASGTVTIAIPASVTSTLDFDTARYDLKLTPVSGNASRLIQGTVTLSPQVSE